MVLVGRESERRAIDSLLTRARVADSGVLVLVGEAGIGKTALLHEAEALAGNMRVLRADGVRSEQLIPFAGLLQLLRPLLPLLAEIPVPQARALRSALLLEPPDTVTHSRFAVGAATLSLLSRAAEDRPIAALVDDGHLLDQPTVEALTFAARRLLSDPVALLVSVRASAPGAAAWSELPSLPVHGLDPESAGRLVAAAVDREIAAPKLQRLHEATGGNPLALLELAEDVDEVAMLPVDGPVEVSERLTRSFIGRAEGLSAPSRTVLLVAAADSTSAATVHRASQELGLADGSLTEAEDAGLVSVTGDRVEFRHPLVRSAVYGAADAPARRAAHRALAAVVPRDEIDRLAWHVSRGAEAPDEATAATLARVARGAAARGAFAIAVQAHERAAELTVDRGRLAPRLLAAAEAAWLAGATAHAIELLDRGLASDPDPSTTASILELRGAIETRCGSLEAARTTLMQAADDLVAADPDGAVRLLSDAVNACFYLADASTALSAAETIEKMLHRTGDVNSRFHGTMALGMARILSGAGRTGSDHIRGAVAMLPHLDGRPDHLRLPRRILAGLWLRETDATRTLLGEQVERLRDETALGALPYLLMHIARDDATTDRWQDAEASYLEAIHLATETGQTTDLAVSLAGLVWLRARQGKADECHHDIPAARDLCYANHIHLGTAWLDFAQGDLEAGLGNLNGAVVHYERLEALLAEAGVSDPDVSPAAELVEACLHLGRADDASALAETFAGRATDKGQPWSMARAHRALALCQEGDTREASFRTALAFHEQTADKYEAARTELAFGACLRRDRRRVEAREHLRSAVEAFEDLGARPWADRAAQELDATGERVQRRGATVIDALTPQERQVAQLLISGRTTREAAAALFISPKTVEYHLRHVYGKLGVRSREALAAALEQ